MGDEVYIDGVSYRKHPSFDNCCASVDSKVANVRRRRTISGSVSNSGYVRRTMWKSKQYGYFSHRFVFECFNDLIPEGYVIDHVNGCKIDNRPCNLQMGGDAARKRWEVREEKELGEGQVFTC